jgi:hypothetical protein
MLLQSLLRPVLRPVMSGVMDGVRSQSTAPAAPALTLEDATSILLLEDGGYLLLEG